RGEAAPRGGDRHNGGGTGVAAAASDRGCVDVQRATGGGGRPACEQPSGRRGRGDRGRAGEAGRDGGGGREAQRDGARHALQGSTGRQRSAGWGTGEAGGGAAAHIFPIGSPRL